MSKAVAIGSSDAVSDPVPRQWRQRLAQAESDAQRKVSAMPGVRQAECQIFGEPACLVIDLCCQVYGPRQLPDLMKQVTEVLIPGMEQLIGIQFEKRNLNFMVAEDYGSTTQPFASTETEKMWFSDAMAPDALVSCSLS